MMTFTPDQWLILLLAFVLGLVLGMALLASPKWKRRYREEVRRAARRSRPRTPSCAATPARWTRSATPPPATRPAGATRRAGAALSGATNVHAPKLRHAGGVEPAHGAGAEELGADAIDAGILLGVARSGHGQMERVRHDREQLIRP